MITLLKARLAFAAAWELIAKDLLAQKEAWNFSKAPKGGHAKIVSNEFAAMFVNAAGLASHNGRLFDRVSFARDYAKAELRPYGRTVSSLSPLERHNQKRRIAQAISAFIRVMVEFGLFEEV